MLPSEFYCHAVTQTEEKGELQGDGVISSAANRKRLGSSASRPHTCLSSKTGVRRAAPYGSRPPANAAAAATPAPLCQPLRMRSGGRLAEPRRQPGRAWASRGVAASSWEEVKGTVYLFATETRSMIENADR